MKPRYKVNLPEHLSGCETNYWRLRRLLPQLIQSDVETQWCFIVGNNPANESNISLKIIEQTKYTTVVHIVQNSSLQKRSPCVKYNNVINEKNALNKKSKDLPNSRTQQNNKNTGSVKQAQPNSSAVATSEVDSMDGDFNADVRLYHDADVAEVVKCQHHRQFSSRYEYPNEEMHQIDEKARINQFLGELLSHCLLHARVADAVVSTEYVFKPY